MKIEKLQYIHRNVKRFWLMVYAQKDKEGKEVTTAFPALDSLSRTFDTKEEAIAYFDAYPSYTVVHILDTETREAWEATKD